MARSTYWPDGTPANANAPDASVPVTGAMRAHGTSRAPPGASRSRIDGGGPEGPKSVPDTRTLGTGARRMSMPPRSSPGPRVIVDACAAVATDGANVEGYTNRRPPEGGGGVTPPRVSPYSASPVISMLDELGGPINMPSSPMP